MEKHQSYKSREPNIAGVILAAGIGKRMGCTKQLMCCAGHPMIQGVIDVAEDSDLSHIVVILGYDAQKILEQIKISRATILVNTSFIAGQSSSLIAGLSEVNIESDAVMFILGDQPLINKNIINKLLKTYRKSSTKNIIVPVYKGSRGNPVIFGSFFFDKLMTLTGDVGGRELIRRYRDAVVEVRVDSKLVLFDVDTYEDYRVLCDQC